MKLALATLIAFLAPMHSHAQANKAQPAPRAQRAQPQRAAPKPKFPAFSANPAVAEFIAKMAAEHGFDADALADRFSKIAPNERALNLVAPSPSAPARPADRSWRAYRARFLNKSRIDGGLAFWRENAETLKRAYGQYGVPPEIVVAIIGVETLYGQQTGGFGVMEALASLAFHDTRRADFFRGELEHFLLLARENGLDPLKPSGSYAGAIGIPQFMPSSWLKFGVDFDGDGIVDLEHSVADSIGSVANYLNEHGWQRAEPVAHKIKLSGKPRDSWLEAGMLPSLQVGELAGQGVQVAPGSPEMATFISLATPGQPTEYWLGYQNYYAITRYNRSTFYAMSVFQLAEEIKPLMDR